MPTDRSVHRGRSARHCARSCNRNSTGYGLERDDSVAERAAPGRHRQGRGPVGPRTRRPGMARGAEHAARQRGIGAAVWAQDGFTAQLNRNDTFPDLKWPGRLVVPGLLKMANAAAYRGPLSLYDAQLVQHGNGMTARAYVRAGADQFVLDVAGADPHTAQTADLKLWSAADPGDLCRRRCRGAGRDLPRRPVRHHPRRDRRRDRRRPRRAGDGHRRSTCTCGSGHTATAASASS